MTCQNCGEQEATVVITKIVGDAHQVTHLCQSCANATGGAGGVAITIQTLTHGGAPATLTCSGCGKSFEEFRKSGLFGCAGCYEVFEPHLERLFRRVQGVSDHAGAETERRPSREELSDLERELKEAVGREDFEQAASLRDRINQINAQGTKTT